MILATWASAAQASSAKCERLHQRQIFTRELSAELEAAPGNKQESAVVIVDYERASPKAGGLASTAPIRRKLSSLGLSARFDERLVNGFRYVEVVGSAQNLKKLRNWDAVVWAGFRRSEVSFRRITRERLWKLELPEGSSDTPSSYDLDLPGATGDEFSAPYRRSEPMPTDEPQRSDGGSSLDYGPSSDVDGIVLF